MKGITKFNHWAMPVYKKRWAFVATIASRAKRITRYKVGWLNTLDFFSWRRATQSA